MLGISQARSLGRKRLKRLRKGLQRLLHHVLQPLASLIGFPLRFLTSAVVMPYFPNRIGHLIVDPAAFLLRRGRHGDGLRSKQDILAVSRRLCANRAVLDSWSEHYRVVSSPLLVRLLAWATRGSALERPGASLYGEVQSAVTAAGTAFGPHAPLLRLSPGNLRGSDVSSGGVVPRGPFICLHVRPGASPYFTEDAKWYSYRLGDVGTYADAVRFLQEQGLAVVLMGDSSQPMPDPELGLIDYAHSPEKSELNDVLLAASCEFWLGDNSGASALAWAYGRPTAISNVAPISHLLWGCAADLKIPRLYARPDGSVLSFAEALASPACSAPHEDAWRAAGLWPVMNTAEELLDLAREMLARVRGEFVPSRADIELEEHLRSLFTPDHATFEGAAGVAHSFLRRHEPLLRSRSWVRPSRAPEGA